MSAIKTAQKNGRDHNIAKTLFSLGKQRLGHMHSAIDMQRGAGDVRTSG